MLTRSESASVEGLRFRFPDGELEGWLVLGDVTDRSVRAWGRLPGGPCEVQLCLAGEVAATATLRPDPQHDHVGVVTLALDPPRPGATFTVEADGVVRAGRFAPEAGTPAGFAFAFGSCHQPFEEKAPRGELRRHPGAAIYEPLRRLLIDRDARFLMLLGDQVYSDSIAGVSARKRLSEDPHLTDEELLETYRHLYRGYFQEHGFRHLAETLPAYLTWDDHDIFDGAGSLLHPTEFDHRLRRAATAAYREYQHLRNPGAAVSDHPPFSYSFWYADVGFHVLDLRGCRDFQEHRIIGDEGWRRFEAFLADADERDAMTVFVAAGVPVVHASPALMTALEMLPIAAGKDVRDRWNVPHFRHERERLLDRLFGWQTARPGRQAVILSGDVHVGAAFSLRPARGRGRIAQWTSSALSTPTGLKHVLANRVVTRFAPLGEPSLRVWRRGLVPTNNVGLVEVQPEPGGGHVVTFRVLAWDRKRGRLEERLKDRATPGGHRTTGRDAISPGEPR